MKNNPTLRKLLLKWHLYGGLLCFWYLVLLGLSSLNFQHHFGWMEAHQGEPATAIKKIHLNLTKTDPAIAVNIQDSLHIAGWTLPWETYRDSAGDFHTQINNPKKEYSIVYHAANSTANLTVKDLGMWNLLNSLHGFTGEMPHAPGLFVWSIFTYTCVVVVVFSIFSGIVLWHQRNKQRVTGWLIFSTILLLSFLFMILIYRYG